MKTPNAADSDIPGFWLQGIKQIRRGRADQLRCLSTGKSQSERWCAAGPRREAGPSMSTSRAHPSRVSLRPHPRGRNWRSPRRDRKYRPPAPGAAVSSARIGRGGRQSPGGRGLAPGSGISGPHAGEGPAGLSSSQRPKATQQVPGPRRPGPPAPSPHAGYPFTPPSLPYPGQHQIEDAAVSGVKQAADRTSSGRAAEPPRALPRAPAFAKRCSPGSRVQPARAATEHRPFG